MKTTINVPSGNQEQLQGIRQAIVDLANQRNILISAVAASRFSLKELAAGTLSLNTECTEITVEFPDPK